MVVRATLIQDSPVFFDKEKSLDKVSLLARQHAIQGHQIIVFPESFLPGYPRGFTFGMTVGHRTDAGRRLYQQYYDNSIDLQSNDRQILESVASETGSYLVMGMTEKESLHGSLFCSVAYISPTKGLLGVHRKIKPTGMERVIWQEASGDSLVGFQTSIGKLGGLICWENYMPLARMAMYRLGVEIYIAPTADARDTWVSSMRHIALEGRCFVLSCNQYFQASMLPSGLQHMIPEEGDASCRGGSLIAGPNGDIIAGPLYGQPGVVETDLNMDEVITNKLDFDVIGHYSRKDIFDFSVIGQPGLIQE